MNALYYILNVLYNKESNYANELGAKRRKSKLKVKFSSKSFHAAPIIFVIVRFTVDKFSPRR